MDEKVKNRLEEIKKESMQGCYLFNPPAQLLQLSQNIKFLLSLLSEKEKEIEELKRNRFLCEVCWQTLEPDGSCYTCRLERRVKELEEILKSIKADPSVGKLEIEDWPENPEY